MGTERQKQLLAGNIRFILVEGPFKTSSTSVASEEPEKKQVINECLLFNC